MGMKVMDSSKNQAIDNEPLKPSDRLLPVANVANIMKGPIPPHAKISKEAKESIQAASSEFIAIVTSVAKDICISENRKTVTSEDLIRAMRILGLNHYANVSKKILVKFKEGGRIIKHQN